MIELEKELTLEMVPDGPYRKIAERIGVGNLLGLADVIGGTTFYLPRPESFMRPARDARIKEEFNGYNHLELALKYEVTTRWVQHLCGVGHMEGQINFFDFEGLECGE